MNARKKITNKGRRRIKQKRAYRRYRSTQTKLEDEEKYLAILKELPDIVYKIDPDGYFTFVNNSVRILGYEPEELIGEHFSKIIHTDDAKTFGRLYVLPKYRGKITGDENAPKLFDERRTGVRKTKNLEVRLIPKKQKNKKNIEPLIGEVIAFGDVSSTGFYNPSAKMKTKKFLGTLGIIRDITDRKRTMEKLHYQADLLQNVSDAIISTDLDFRIRTWNRAAEQMYGWQAYEDLGKPLHKVTHSIFPSGTEEKVMKELFKKEHWRGELIQERKDGSRMKVLSSISLINDHTNNYIGTVAVNHDITEQKKAEENILKKHKELKMLQEITATLHSSLELNKIFKQITEGFINLLEYNSAFILMLNEQKNRFEVKTFSTRHNLLQKINEILGYSIKNLSFSADADLGAKTRSALTGKIVTAASLEEIAYPILSKKICHTLQKIGNSQNYMVVPLEIEKKIIGGIMISSPRKEISEEELEIVKTLANTAATAINNAYLLMQTREAEKALRESEEKYSSVVENSKDAIIIHQNGIIKFANSAACKIGGYKFKEFLGKNITNFIEKKHHELIRQRIKDRLAGKSVSNIYEIEILKKDGTVIPAEINSTIINYLGKPAFLIFMRDITERRRSEEEVIQRTKELATLNTISKVISQSLYLRETLSAALAKILEVMNLEIGGIYLADETRSKLELLVHRGVSKKFAEDVKVISVDERTIKMVERKGKLGKFILSLKTIISNPKGFERILSAIKKEGLNLKYMHYVLLQAKGKVVGLMIVGCRTSCLLPKQEERLLTSIAQQISLAIINAQLYEESKKELKQRIEAEEKLKASLKEKEALLKEIHHRVKNNLQIISSLLNLQAGYIKDEYYQNLFKESQNRIKSMVLIHEKLYQSKDLANIKADDYIEGLVRHLFHSYGVKPKAVVLKKNIKNVTLNIDTAIPCGLIINELISNSLKHAFPRSLPRSPEITLKLFQDKRNRTVLIVSDNGVGLPKNIDFKKTKSLGLQLVSALVEQLGGIITVEVKEGTKFTITFKK